MTGIFLILILILGLIAAIPTWPHSKNWGYYPCGGVGILLMAVMVMMFAGMM